MRRSCLSAVLVLFAAMSALAAPPEVPTTLKAEPGDIVEVVVKVPVKQEIGYRLVGGKALFRELRTETPGERVFWFNAKQGGTYSVVWWSKGETASAETVITVGAPTPPVPPDPPTPPDPPKPPPDGPLRVIFVYESGVLLTPAQQRVIYGAKVREYLDAKSKGWRRYDGDVDAGNEKDADLKALWRDAKAKMRPDQTYPCVIVARGTSAEILPLPADEDAAVALFAKYAGGK
jgi:hypothetical protein